jgi:hypothetical protein
MCTYDWYAFFCENVVPTTKNIRFTNNPYPLLSEYCYNLLYDGGGTTFFCFTLPGADVSYQKTAIVETAPEKIRLDDGSMYQSAPGAAEGVKSELYQNTRVDCAGKCWSGQEPGDPDAIAFQAERDPNASTESHQDPVKVEPIVIPPTTAEPITKMFHKDQDYGNSQFGAGYVLDASLTAYPATVSNGAQLQISAEGQLVARVLGKRPTIMRAMAAAHSEQGGDISADVHLYLLKNEIWGESYHLERFHAPHLFNRVWQPVPPFPISIGVITLELGVDVGGEAGLDIYGDLTTGGPKFVLAPAGAITAVGYADVSIGVPGLLSASIGVEGQVRLLDVAAPITLAAVPTACNELRWRMGAGVTVDTLAGRLLLVAKIRIAFIKKKKEFTITEWSSLGKSFEELLSATADYPFQFQCSGGQPIGGTGTVDITPPPPTPPPPAPTMVQLTTPYTYSSDDIASYKIPLCYISRTALYSGGPYCPMSVRVSGNNPTGTVSFYADGYLTSTLSLSGGSLATNERALGLHPENGMVCYNIGELLVVYSGDANNSPSSTTLPNYGICVEQYQDSGG